MDTRKYNAIDLWKFIMAFFVVALHVNPLEGCTITVVNRMYDCFAAMAVPFFFLAAGFLLAKKLQYPIQYEESDQIIKGYIKRMLKLYLMWSVVYFPLAVFHYMVEKRRPLTAVLAYIRGLVFVGEHYNSWQLWYLLSTIYALLFVLLLLKNKQSIERIACIGFVIFLISIGVTYLTNYYGGGGPGILSIAAKIFKLTINDGLILTGMFYIPAGMLLSQKTLSLRAGWIILIVSFALNYIINDPSISTLLVAFSSIGLFKVVEETNLKDSGIYFVLRKLSMVIYLIHMLIWTIFYCAVYGEKTYGLDSYVVTVGISCIIGFGYVAYLKKRK